MTLDKNSSPYYDDYNEDKKYVQLLFRPSIAVQARELSQIQSTLQKQIERFGLHVFEEGSQVIPGEIGLDTDFKYVRLEQQYNSSDINVSNFANKTVYGTTSGAIAQVIDTETISGDDPNTLYISYETGDSAQTFTASISSGSNTITGISISATSNFKVGANISGTGIPSNTYITAINSSSEIEISNNATTTNGSASLTYTTASVFSDAEVLVTSDGTYNATVLTDSNSATGSGSRVTIQRGVYFALGYFLLVDTQSLILEKYSNTPSYKIGITLTDEFVNENDDSSLNDPATGSFNFNAPGAHRYKVDLTLTKFGLATDTGTNFIELLRVSDGEIQKLVTRPNYSELEKTLARRTFDESGNYTVRTFPAQIKEHLDDGINFGYLTSSNGGDASKLALLIEPGKAYVQGFEIETVSTNFLEISKPRTTDTKNNSITPFTLGNYVNVSNIKGIPDITSYESVELLSVDKSDSNYPGTVLGTARIRGLEFVSGTPGDAAAKYRAYIFDVEMNSDSNGEFSFGDVRAIATGSQAEDMDVTLVSGNAVLNDSGESNTIFSLTDSVIETLSDTSYTVKRYSSGTMTGTDLTLSAGTDGIFSSYSVSNYQVAIITASGTATGNGFADGDIIDMSAAGNSITLGGSPTGKQVTVTVPDIAGSTIGVISTVTKSSTTEKTKTLTTNNEVLSFSSTVQLEKADIYDITSIVDTNDSSATDIKDRFVLDNGQRDNFYDRGRLVFKSQYPQPSGNLDITYRFFQHGSGDYFSVDSYDGVVDYEDIPTYVSPTTSKRYELRDSVDFRPRVNDAGTGFSVTSEIVATGQNFITDYEFYLPRIDKLFLNTLGEFSIISGIPSVNPTPPKAPANGITLYEISLPAYGLNASDINLFQIDNKRYTMRDIGRLEKRIETLEYYTSLSLLEKETADLFIDDGTGTNRFKNGFLVDNFTSHLIGDNSLADYQCSIDKEKGILRPKFSSNSVSLTLDTGSSSNYQKTGDLITLPYTTTDFIVQPFASKTENINPYDVFNWVGSITLDPSSDEWYETSQAPDRIIVNDDGLADSLAALDGQVIWNDWQTNWLGTPISSSELSSRSFIQKSGDGRGIRRVTETTSLVARQQGQSRSGVRLNVQETTTTQSLGDRVVNTQTIPWIREKDIDFTCTGLKPNTEVFPFFDNVNVSSYTKPTGGTLGDSLISNSNGEVSGTFELPNDTDIRFRTGERVFKLVDNNNDNVNFITTSANAIYTAKGVLETKEETILSTRSAKVVTTDVSDDRVIVGTDIQSRRSATNWYDPLAQTFLIDNEGGVFISSIDIFFAQKDSSGVPVTLQIRNVVNGYPGQFILPFSEVTLNPSSVNTSSDGSTATTFTFDSPVYLQDDTEYCFVLLANSTEYLIWVSKIGEFDVTTEERISRQPYAGVMFKSQNASTWTADQEQDIKFTIERCVFNTGVTGSVQFRNDTVPYRTLPFDPFTTTDSSTTVNVYFPNHGMQDGEDLTIQGVTENVNGIPFSELNATHTITYVDFDNFTITSSTNADATGVGGGSTVQANGNLRADVINPLLETITLPGTTLSSSVKVRDTSNALHSTFIPIELKDNSEFTDERILFNEEEEDATKSLHLQNQFSSTSDSISPVIDVERASVVTITNRINNDSTDETNADSGNSIARYITKPISLASSSTGIRVHFAAYRPPLATIKVYAKYLKETERESIFEDLPYYELNEVDYPTGSETEFKDYVFELMGLEDFSVFAIKIVMLSSETSDCPKIKDFRTIATAT